MHGAISLKDATSYDKFVCTTFHLTMDPIPSFNFYKRNAQWAITTITYDDSWNDAIYIAGFEPVWQISRYQASW